MNKKTNSIRATFALGAAFSVATGAALTATAGDTYTWGLSAPANAQWNTTDANWSKGGSSVPWADNSADPNSAVFPQNGGTSSGGTDITVNEKRYVNDLTINGPYYKFYGTGPITVAGTINVDGAAGNFYGSLASGRADGSLRFSSTGSKYIYVRGSNQQTSTYLNGPLLFAAFSDAAFGVVPGSEAENIFIVNNSTIYGGGAFAIHSNRTIRISSGKSLSTRTDSSPQFTYKNRIVADNSPGCDYSTNTYVSISKDTTYPIAFDTGDGRTNAFGRLQVYGRSKITSGVTMLSGSGNPGTSSAHLYVQGNNSSFPSSKGDLLIDGGELYTPLSGYIDIREYGQVTVTNGGKVYMPNARWINGYFSPGLLIVANGGEFTVGTLYPSMSATKSEVFLNEGGLMRVNTLFPDGTPKFDFHFNGGTFEALTASPFEGSKWNSDTRFLVDEKGAVFSVADGKTLWWQRPLESGAASDGGVRKTASNSTLLFKKANTYNGPTQVDGGALFCLVDGALPSGTKVKLANGARVDCYTFDQETPSRSTTNWVSRVEGDGTMEFSSQLHVTNSIAPSTSGTIRFTHVCDLRGDLEIATDAEGCGKVKFDAAGQSIAGLSLKLAAGATLDSTKRYQVVDAPNGLADGSRFASAELPTAWEVRYTSTGVELRHIDATVLIFR